MALWIVCCILLSLVSTVGSYSSGAPYSTCLSQFPNHYAEALTSQTPFIIRVREHSYSPGQVISVDVAGSRSFTGLSLRARRMRGDTEEILGTFVSMPTEVVQAHNCLGGTENLITQRNHRSKSNVTVGWKAPDHAVGDIVFTATVVVSFTQFWVHVLSNPVRDASGSGDKGHLENVKNTSMTFNFEEECGAAKGCFLYPDTCTGSDCVAAISYQMDGDYVHFEMMGVSEGWMALGLSEDRNMGDDDIILCSAQKTRVSIQHGYNPAYYYERQYTAGITNMATMEKDGKIYCTFTRPVEMTSVFVTPNTNPPVITDKVFDLRRDWYIQLAWGYVFDGVDAINKHEELPIMTSQKVNFREFSIKRGRPIPVALQAHGCLMILAWMLFASLGMVVSRNFREGIGSKEIFGVKIWFQFHRVAGFLVLGFTILGIIIIFAGVRRWSQAAQGHAILGIIITVAAIGQFVMGFLRPEPNASYRPCFVWIHRFLGKTAQILAAVEFILAFKIELFPMAMRDFGLPVIVVWIVAQIAWEIGLNIYRCILERRDIRSFVLSSQMQLDEKSLAKPHTLMSALFVIYCVSILTLTITAMCAVLIF